MSRLSAEARAVRTSPHLGARPALTGLRAVAVLLVMLHHEGIFLAPGHNRWLAPTGFLGLDLFFVLSGFLITSLLLEERERAGRIRLAGFYERRVRRLLPALVVLLAGWTSYAIAADHLGSSTVARSDAIVLGYATNLYKASPGHDVIPGLGQLWSLSVEEHFYFVWPLLVLVLLRRNARLVAAVAGIGVVASTIDMAVTYRTVGHVTAYYRTDCRAGALMIGCLLSVAWREGWLDARLARWLLLPALGGLLAVAELTTPPSTFMFSGGFTLLEILAAVAVLGAVEPGPVARALLTNRAVLWIGEISYAMYLWHVAVVVVLAEHVHASLGIRSIVYWPAVVVLASLSQVLVERPLRRRRAPTPARVPAARGVPDEERTVGAGPLFADR